MRKDMKKVLCERPRTHSDAGYHDVRSAENRGDIDLLPHHQGMRMPYIRGFGEDSKDFTDLIGPLYRFLWGCVGRPWNEVWSEICQQVPSNNTVDGHLKDHVRREIDIHTYVADNVVYVLPGGFSRRAEPFGLFVDPRNGLLRAASDNRHNSWYRTPRPIQVHHRGEVYWQGDDGILYPLKDWRNAAGRYPLKLIDDQTEAVLIKGIWYRVVFALVPAPREVVVYSTGDEPVRKLVHYPQWDVLTGTMVSTGSYRAKKQQLSSAGLRRLGLRNIT